MPCCLCTVSGVFDWAVCGTDGLSIWHASNFLHAWVETASRRQKGVCDCWLAAASMDPCMHAGIRVPGPGVGLAHMGTQGDAKKPSRRLAMAPYSVHGRPRRRVRRFIHGRLLAERQGSLTGTAMRGWHIAGRSAGQPDGHSYEGVAHCWQIGRAAYRAQQ